MLKATPESPRMFQSDFLDLFSRTHWSVVPIIFLPITSLMLWYSAVRVDAGWLLSLAIAVAGFIGWTLTEYWLHRLFFHWQPPGALGERMHFLVHGVHHEWPSDKYRLVMPPAVSISLYFIFLGIFYALFSLLNCTSYVWAWHAGFVVGYVFYDCVHYWLHHHTPKSAYWVKLKKNHMIHHFKDHDSRFCVSNMFWDKIFGTAGE